MKVLLDTHTLLWATLSPSRLSPKVAGIIGDESNLILVSAASAWEIATKVRLGRLRRIRIQSLTARASRQLNLRVWP